MPLPVHRAVQVAEEEVTHTAVSAERAREGRALLGGRGQQVEGRQAHREGRVVHEHEHVAARVLGEALGQPGLARRSVAPGVGPDSRSVNGVPRGGRAGTGRGDPL